MQYSPLPIAQTSGIRVRVSGVRRSFEGGVVALDGIDLDVAPGEFLAILGPSGCGKSTLLRLIAGLDSPQAGEVQTFARENVQVAWAAGRRADLAYVFQDAHLLPWRSVLQNVALPLELMHQGRGQRLDASRRAIELVGLTEAVDRFPAQLSGGQRMRVSLARAMVTNPRLLLLDEPFAALDEITRQHLDEQLRRLWAAMGMTIIFVTHSTTEAAYLAQRAVVMTRRPGRIIADHRIALADERPAALRGSAEFAQETRVLYSALERGGA
ncbi:MAG TPA: ABC transporter ATP-binding protein [Tepidisphaeraceae bacterium]|jgi:NitT/TauT family transport system ATP-binding protein|nr:ABC transporter ATP-binding protein [Tepidisphaeraceae bacterium]